MTLVLQVRSALLLISAIVLVACSSAQRNPAYGSVADLTSSDWVLSDISGSDMNTDRRPTLRFAEEASVSGFSGCNSYNGSVDIGVATIVFEKLASTRRDCRNAVMNFESAYLQALRNTQAWSIEINALRFLDSSGNTVLKFRRMGSQVNTNI